MLVLPQATKAQHCSFHSSLLRAWWEANPALTSAPPTLRVGIDFLGPAAGLSRKQTLFLFPSWKPSKISTFLKKEKFALILESIHDNSYENMNKKSLKLKSSSLIHVWTGWVNQIVNLHTRLFKFNPINIQNDSISK